MEWYWNDDGKDPVWFDGDEDIEGYEFHDDNVYKQSGESEDYKWYHYSSTESGDSPNDNSSQYFAYLGVDDNLSVAPDRSSVQSSQSRGAEVVSSFPVSDPNSNFGLGNSYNLYTPNQTKAAEKIILAIGTAGLATETGVAAALGEVAMIGLKKIGVISLAQFAGGFVEGTLKSFFGPDPEMSSSMLLNPVSDLGLNVTAGIWNTATILDKNPLPSYP